MSSGKYVPLSRAIYVPVLLCWWVGSSVEDFNMTTLEKTELKIPVVRSLFCPVPVLTGNSNLHVVDAHNPSKPTPNQKPGPSGKPPLSHDVVESFEEEIITRVVSSL